MNIAKEFENAYNEFKEEQEKQKNSHPFIDFNVFLNITDEKISKEVKKLVKGYDFTLDVITDTITELMELTQKVHDLDILFKLFKIATNMYKKSNEFKKIIEGE